MNEMNYKKIIKSQNLRFKILNCFGWIPDKMMIKIQYRIKTGRKLNLNKPKRFTEKIQWYKLYYRNPLMHKCVDKYDVREYVKSKGLNKILNEMYGIYDKPEDIDYDKLPNKFVIKTTAGSGGQNVFVCHNKEKLDKKEILQKLKYWQKLNPKKHFGREWAYQGLKNRIIVEKYIESDSNGLVDYKFFCFNGEAKIFKIDFDRFVEHHANYYDLNGNILPFGEKNYPPKYDKQINMPVNLKEMIKYANLLSKNIPFVRIDFYEINKKLYFGEITFYPASGLCEFTDYGWDLKLGNWIMFPKEINDEK